MCRYCIVRVKVRTNAELIPADKKSHPGIRRHKGVGVVKSSSWSKIADTAPKDWFANYLIQQHQRVWQFVNVAGRAGQCGLERRGGVLNCVADGGGNVLTAKTCSEPLT